MTLYALRLAIHYDFARPTGAGRQLFRILPAETPGVQRLIQSRVILAPAPAERLEFTDFFGTRVIEVAMPPGLTRLDLVLEAEVERARAEPELDMSPRVAALAAELADWRDIGPASPHHFRAPSRRIPPMAAVASFAAAATRGARTVQEAVIALGEALHDHMTFDAKATEVDTSPAHAFALRRGVCQDFAQIMVGGLRSLGIPAAYVAGYLRTRPPPGKPRLVGADAMHAWVRAWAGAKAGWIDYDPTNACRAGADHIDVGFGRDYGDVAPVTGMLRLDGSQAGSHSVDIVESVG
ncbi:transglutaminase family protein [Gemmobacter nectariphilus]|uniref:transglutaminase family protein n=1 Tax=Gemmobacter nectariphilus TaxID=220343 RepID=UPI000405EBCD|nr:transglutaminase family protein [Gemmobacter nectariphilus]